MTRLSDKRVLIASDVRGVRMSGGVAATHPAGVYANFLAIAEPFAGATVISRDATHSTEVRAHAGWMTGALVAYRGVPDFTTFGGMFCAVPATAREVWRALGENDVAYVRLPEPLSVTVGLLALFRRRPLVVNLVANPRTRGGGADRSTGRLLLVSLTSFLIKRAVGVVYVTREQLQADFPSRPGVPTCARSNVRIDAVVREPRVKPAGAVRLLTVGMNSGLAKGQDLVLEAVALLQEQGVPVEAEFVGGGDSASWLERRAKDLGVTDVVTFRGHVADHEVIAAAYDRADVFCLPSRSEGLPRAMIEAMARGLPPVGTRVGGIPELLPDRQLMKTPTARDLAARVSELVLDAELYENASLDAIIRAAVIYEEAKPEKLHAFLEEILT